MTIGSIVLLDIGGYYPLHRLVPPINHHTSPLPVSKNQSIMACNKGISDVFDPNKAKVSDLRIFLRDHNVPISVVKSVLIDKAKVLLDLDLPNVKRLQESDMLSTEEHHLERFC